MDRHSKPLLFSCLLICLFAGSSSAQSCSSFTTFSSNKLYSRCNDLPVLSSFLHWTYHQSNGTADIAYRHGGFTTSRWVAWALNPNGTGMNGAQSLVAFQNSNGGVRAYTSPVAGYNTLLAEGDLSFEVSDMTAQVRNGEMIIYATLQLPGNRTSFNHVWQEGPLSGDRPQRHALDDSHTGATGRLDFLSGVSTAPTGGAAVPRLKRKNVHGVLNAVSWGILMPIGAVIARYLRVFKSADPAWFYLHVACQSSAYAVGVAGWGTGLKLGSDSSGVKYSTHRNIGLTLFILGTLQVFALLLRPKKDHKYRIYWNAYHHAVGYAVISLSIVNVFEGLDILDPDGKWKKAYIGILIFLGSLAILLEAFTWYVVLKRRKTDRSDKYPHVANGTNGVGHYGAQSQQAV